MSSDAYAVARGAFIAALRRAWNAAGTPSYQEMELLSVQILKRRLPGQPELVQLATSTLQGILSEQRVRPPKWPRVLTLILVLHEAARRAGLDSRRIGSVEVWQRRHEALCAAEMAARQPTGAGRRSGGLSASGPANWQVDDFPRRLLDEADEDARLGEVLGLVQRIGTPQWWYEYQDLVPDRLGFYLYLESIAQMIRVYKARVLPGLLQTEAYARALQQYLEPGASEAEIARSVELRMRRQQILGSQEPPRLWALVGETALRNQHAGSPVMRAQIRHLIEITAQPNVTLQVLRDDRKHNDTIKEPLTIFRFAEPHIGDVAFLGLRQPDGLVLHERKSVDHYSQWLGHWSIKACDPSETTDLLRNILADALRPCIYTA